MELVESVMDGVIKGRGAGSGHESDWLMKSVAIGICGLFCSSSVLCSNSAIGMIELVKNSLTDLV